MIQFWGCESNSLPFEPRSDAFDTLRQEEFLCKGAGEESAGAGRSGEGAHPAATRAGQGGDRNHTSEATGPLP